MRKNQKITMVTRTITAAKKSGIRFLPFFVCKQTALLVFSSTLILDLPQQKRTMNGGSLYKDIIDFQSYSRKEDCYCGKSYSTQPFFVNNYIWSAKVR